MKYGALPKDMGIFYPSPFEMFFYQDMPIKMASETTITMEDRLRPFDRIVGAACCDFVGHRGLDEFVTSYVYISAKRMFVSKDSGFNRPGWHTDGFGSDDINYVWSDRFPTVFNTSDFNLPEDDSTSMKAMEDQADPENDFQFPEFHLLRLDQFCVHKVAEVTSPCIRAFVKVSISRSKYDLAGNTHNHLLDYDWPLRERHLTRNVPQGM